MKRNRRKETDEKKQREERLYYDEDDCEKGGEFFLEIEKRDGAGAGGHSDRDRGGDRPDL